LRHETFANGHALIPFLAQQADAIRARLKGDELAVRNTAARPVIYPSTVFALTCPFTRPARLRHRGEVFDLAAVDASATHTVAVQMDGNRWHVQCGGTDLVLDDVSFDPPAGAGGGAGGNELRAPFNGKVVGVTARPGATVAQGDVLVVVESMKLEHSLAAARAGVVAAVAVQAGQQVVPGQMLVTLEPA
jgi:3-methylcrotonyl-CoA carboxylase alpha subunit/geranyl-CoA carboxylase alpha subunit